MEFTLLWAALTGIGGMWAVVRATPDARAIDGFDVLLGSVGFGILVGRLTAMLLAGVNPVTHPADIVLIRGGVDTVGAAVATVGSVIWAVRDRIPAALDALAPAIAAGLAGWHGGCLWRSACLGERSTLPWAWSLPGSDVARHPVELYTAGILLITAAIAWKLRSSPWAATGTVVTGVAVSRFATASLRLSVDPTPTPSLILMMAVGLAISTMAWRHKVTVRDAPRSM